MTSEAETTTQETAQASTDEHLASARDPRRVGSFIGLVISRLGPRSLQLVGGTFLTLLVASRTTSALAITFALTAHRLFLWLVYPLVGNLSDRTSSRVGRRVPYMSGALVAMGAFTWLWTVAPGYWPLVAVILGTRLAASANQLTSIVAVPEVFGRSRWARALGSVWIVGFGVSVILRGTVVATWNDADPATWNTTFRLAAVFMAVAGVAVLVFVREAPGVSAVVATTDHGRFRERFADFVAAPGARPLMVTCLSLAVSVGAVQRLFPVYAEQVLGATTAQLALLPFILLPASLGVGALGALLAGRLRRRTWIVLAGVVISIVAAVGLFATSLWQPLVASLAVTLVMSAASIALLPMLLRLLPQRGSLGERLGLLAGPVSAAVVIGAYAAGILVDLLGGYESIWWVSLGVGPLVAVSALALRGPDARQRGGISDLVRAGRQGVPARRPAGRRGRRPSLFGGQLEASDLDATAVVTTLRDFADAALMDQGPARRRASRLIDLVNSDLSGTSRSGGKVRALIDEEGRLHEGAEADRRLTALREQVQESWRPVDHHEGEAVTAPVGNGRSFLLVSRSSDGSYDDLEVRRHDDGDASTWFHPVQVDLAAVGQRHRARRRRRRVVRAALGAFGWPAVRRLTRQPVTRVEWARRARQGFGDLGGAYVKFGQLLASSPSFVGAEAAAELRALLDNAPPVPIKEVRSAITAGLGRPVDEIFASIDPDPLGAASLAVVHRATLVSGEVVAVKVLRPGIEINVAADLDLLERVAGRATALGIPIADGLVRALGFLRVQMAEELDLHNERRSMATARRRFDEVGFDLVTAPRSFDDLCSSTVLTMEYLDGVPLDASPATHPSRVGGAETRAPIAVDPVAVDQAIKAWFLTAVRDGWFHGDVHAGNLLALRDGRVAFIDWGVTGRLSTTTRLLLADLLGASLDVPGARDRLVDRIVAQIGLDPALVGPVMRELLADRLTGMLTTPFGESRLGAILEQGPAGSGLGAEGAGLGGGMRRDGSALERSTFLLAKQLIYFEHYGAIHLTGSSLLSDRNFFAALLDAETDEAELVAAGRLERDDVLPAARIESVGVVESQLKRELRPRRGGSMRFLRGLLPLILLVAMARFVWPTPSGVVLQGVLVGALTAFTALGLALVWRAKRVINFAQGDLGAPVAVATVLVVLATPVPIVVALPLGLIVALISGFAVDWLVLRRLDRSPRLIVTVATIGLAQLLAGLAVLLPLQVEPDVLARSFPQFLGGEALIGGVRFDSNDLLIAVLVVLVLGALGWVLQRSRLGLAIRASAQLPERAATLGVSVRGTQAAVWILATGLSFLAVFLRVGTVGVPIGEVLGPGILLRALAAFVLAPRDRLWPIVTASLGIGILETSITYAASDASIVDPVLAGVIAVGLLARRPRRADRSDADATSAWFASSLSPATLTAALQRRHGRRIVVNAGVVLAAILVMAPFLLTTSQTAALTAVFCFALAATSLVVVSGWNGHLSLGQLAFAGTGGAVLAWLSSVGSADPLLALVVATAVGAVTAGVAGLPAFRARGVYYSVATLAFGVAASATLLNPGWSTWIPRGSLPRGELLGVLDLAGERTFYWFVLAVVVLGVLALLSIGRHQPGRRLRAVRDNSATAEAFGVSARVVTLVGFSISGAVAGLAGGLIVMQQQSFGPSLFDTVESLRLLTAAVTGGLDSLGGALLGASLFYGIDWLSPSSASWLRLASSGLGVLLILLLLPRGLGPAVGRGFARWVMGPAMPVPRGPVPFGGHDAAGVSNHATETPGSGPVRLPGPQAAPVALRVRGLAVTLDNRRILSGVDLDVAPGEIVALVGTNGAGKSTLLNAVAGVVPTVAGWIDLGGNDVTDATPQQRAGAGLALVPGGRAVFPELTVGEHLDLASWLHGPRSAATQVRDRGVVSAMLPQIGDLMHRKGGELSGGQQQLLAIAMALVSAPKVLLVDELSLGLAPAVVTELVTVLRQLRARGVAIVVVEQSVSTALEVADRVVFLEKGMVRLDGQPDELRNQPELLRSVFLTGGDTPMASMGRLVGGPVVLRAEDLRRSFGGITAVEGASFTIAAGEIVGLIGPNGAGKTTTLDLLSGLHRPDGGRVWLGEHRIDRLSPAQRARLGMVRSFQDARLFPSLTALQCVAVSLDLDARWTDPFLTAVRFPTAVDAERRLLGRARELLEANGLAEFADVPVRALSTGVRRMVDLACVSGRTPSVILLDEPSAGIAGVELDGLAARIVALRATTGAAVVVVEHDLALITSIADRLIAMVSGRVTVEGSPQVVLAHPTVEMSYLGSAVSTGG